MQLHCQGFSSIALTETKLSYCIQLSRRSSAAALPGDGRRDGNTSERADLPQRRWHRYPYLAAYHNGGRAARGHHLSVPLRPDPRAQRAGWTRGREAERPQQQLGAASCARARRTVPARALCRRRPYTLCVLARLPPFGAGAVCRGWTKARKGTVMNGFFCVCVSCMRVHTVPF